MNIRSNAVFINQADEERYEEKIIAGNVIRVVTTRERGLSHSRNSAIEKAVGDICVIADDDVRYHDNCCTIIEQAYREYPEADIIAFIVSSTNKQRAKVYKNKTGKLGFIGLLRIASYEITFRRKNIIGKKVSFNTKFGAGSAYAGVGEESIFLQECRKGGLKTYFIAREIGVVSHDESTWFAGYSEKYFFHKGIAIRIIMGFFVGILFCCYFVIAHYTMYHTELSLVKALKSMLRGLTAKIE